MVFLRNYQQDKDKLKSFVEEFYEDSPNGKNFIYKEQILKISKREQSCMYINLDHIHEYDEDLLQAIEKNGLRYQKLTYEAIDEILYDIGDVVIKDAFDIFIDHRLRAEQALHASTLADTNGAQTLTLDELKLKFPSEIMRRYEVYFVARKNSKTMSIRNVLSAEIGQIVRIKAIVTRISIVKPIMKVATYACDRCGSETYQEVVNCTFMPLTNCMSDLCKNESAKNTGRLHLQQKGSKNSKFQELRIQEVADQVPIGNIPRNMTVNCVGENTRLVQPGDHVYITGVFLPKVRTGFKSIIQGLTMDMYLDAHSLHRISKDEFDDMTDVSPPSADELSRLRESEMYSLMARSIAPEIFGHEDIKRALLIMLVGGSGVDNSGIKIRGSINICLMGDPGVAKSQLLSFVDRLSPRSQYTTGRGSSGVGLTASVFRDKFSNEVTLEAGSLVLADGGVCCIDEFDKMAESDRTAIHEVMEQQTVSIAKAGITTTLNARVSILAAANPAYGRYNIRRTIEQNIDLPAALLSRFDLLWLIQDKPDRENDLRLAQHITYVHANNEAPVVANDTTLLSMRELRRFLSIIKMHPDPVVPEGIINYLVGAYVSMRKEKRVGKSMDTTFVCARSMLGMLRLSTALARMRLQTEVERINVDEAIRLIESSKASVSSTRAGAQRTQLGFKEVIYQQIRRLATDSGRVRMADVSTRCVALGYTPDQIKQVVDCYSDLNVWQTNVGATWLQMVN